MRTNQQLPFFSSFLLDSGALTTDAGSLFHTNVGGAADVAAAVDPPSTGADSFADSSVFLAGTNGAGTDFDPAPDAPFGAGLDATAVVANRLTPGFAVLGSFKPVFDDAEDTEVFLEFGEFGEMFYIT